MTYSFKWRPGVAMRERSGPLPLSRRACCRNCKNLRFDETGDAFYCVQGMPLRPLKKDYQASSVCAEFGRPHIEADNAAALEKQRAWIARLDALIGGPPPKPAEKKQPDRARPLAEKRRKYGLIKDAVLKDKLYVLSKIAAATGLPADYVDKARRDMIKAGELPKSCQRRSDLDYVAVRRRVEAGLTRRAAAKEFGVSHSTVDRILRDKRSQS